MSSIIANIIIVTLVVLAVGLALRYIYKEKKKGVNCIGCPSAGNCHEVCYHVKMDSEKEKQIDSIIEKNMHRITT